MKTKQNKKKSCSPKSFFFLLFSFLLLIIPNTDKIHNAINNEYKHYKICTPSTINNNEAKQSTSVCINIGIKRTPFFQISRYMLKWYDILQVKAFEIFTILPQSWLSRSNVTERAEQIYIIYNIFLENSEVCFVGRPRTTSRRSTWGRRKIW